MEHQAARVEGTKANSPRKTTISANDFFSFILYFFSSLFMSLGEAFLSSGICRCCENQYQLFKCETKSEIKYQQSDSTHPVYTGPYSDL